MQKTITLGDYRRFVAENHDIVLSHAVDSAMLASFFSALVQENPAKEVDDLPDDLILGKKTAFIFDAIQASLRHSGQL